MRKWIIRIALAALALALTGAVSSYLFVDRELSRMYGGLTEVAQPELPEDQAEAYALKDVNVLATTGDHFLPGQTVLIRGGLIQTVTDESALPNGLTQVSGNGLYLVPGFTDSHVHLWESENDLLLYVANGVTQVRDMNSLPMNLRWKAEVSTGRIGPEIFAVAPQFATFGPFEGAFVGWTQHKTIARTDEQVNAAAQAYAQDGYDALKASSYLSRDGYIALSKAAADNDIPLIGHLPVAITLDDLWASNQSEVAHIEEFVKALDREFGGYDADTAEDFLDFVRERRDDVADRLIENGISITSTLKLVDSFHRQKSNLHAELRAAELAYENPGIAEGTVITSRGMGWLPEVNIYRWPEGLDEARRARSQVYWQAYGEANHILFEAMLEKGVPIMAGTDANVPVEVPGFSFHDEMRALREAGMTPAEVLASATTVPAGFMKTNTGTIQAGAKANLVLLRGNPLEDIGATDSIEMVVLNGKTLSRSDLDLMLEAVATANDKSRTEPIAFP